MHRSLMMRCKSSIHTPSWFPPPLSRTSLLHQPSHHPPPNTAHHDHHIPQPQDPKAFPCPEDGEVHSLWYMEDGGERPAKLHGCVFWFRWVGPIAVLLCCAVRWMIVVGGYDDSCMHVYIHPTRSLEGEERDAYWAHLKQFAPSHARHGSEEEAGGGAESEGRSVFE